jgi:ribosomal protein L11 methylase PrmA
VVVLSGILGEQVREVAATYAVSGFRLLRKEIDHNWATLTLRHVGGRRRRSL